MHTYTIKDLYKISGILLFVVVFSFLSFENVNAATVEKDSLTLTSCNSKPYELLVSLNNNGQNITCESSDENIVFVSYYNQYVHFIPGNVGEADVTINEDGCEPFVCHVKVVNPILQAKYKNVIYNTYDPEGASFKSDEDLSDLYYDREYALLQIKPNVLDLIYSFPDGVDDNTGCFIIDGYDNPFSYMNTRTIPVVSSDSTILDTRIDTQFGQTKTRFNILKAGEVTLTRKDQFGMTCEHHIVITQKYIDERARYNEISNIDACYDEFGDIYYGDTTIETIYGSGAGYRGDTYLVKAVINGTEYPAEFYYDPKGLERKCRIKIPVCKIGQEIEVVSYSEEYDYSKSCKITVLKYSPKVYYQGNVKKKTIKILVPLDQLYKGDTIKVNVGGKTYTKTIKSDGIKKAQTFKVKKMTKKSKVKVTIKNKFKQTIFNKTYKANKFEEYYADETDD